MKITTLADTPFQKINLLTEKGTKWLTFQKYLDAIDFECPRPILVNGYLRGAQKYGIQKKTFFRLPDIGCYKMENISIYGLGIMVNQKGSLLYSDDIYFRKEFLAQSILPSFKADLFYEDGNITSKYTKKNKYIEGPTVLLSQRGVDIYGHWLLDLLPKAYMIKNMGITDVSYIIPNNIPKYAITFLNYLGIKEKQIIKHDFKKEILVCKQLIVPTHTRFGEQGTNIHPFVGSFYNEVFNNKIEKGHRLVYVSRDNAKNQARRLLNRIEVGNILSKYGFETMYPEQLSLDEQIKIFSETKYLIGEFGSALHNSLFGPPNMSVISLSGNHLVNMMQQRVCCCKGQDTAYVFGESIYKKTNRINADFIINPKHLIIALDEILKK